MVFEDRVIKEEIKLKKRPVGRALLQSDCSPCEKGNRENTTICKPKREPLEETKAANNLILNFQLPHL
jgi:hypothetical protein